jgi:hypothetical protein
MLGNLNYLILDKKEYGDLECIRGEKTIGFSFASYAPGPNSNLDVEDKKNGLWEIKIIS